MEDENQTSVRTIYLDFCFWKIPPQILEVFWKLPVWEIINLHNEFSERYAKETNLSHHVEAQIASFGVNAFRSFASKKGEQVDVSEPSEFLAFQLPEDKNPLTRELESEISIEAAEDVVWVAKKGLAPRAIAEIKKVPELWKAICELSQYQT